MNAREPNDRLPSTLATWRVSPPADPNFRPAVWQRIRARTQETWARYVRAHLIGWSVATVAAVAVAGWTGHHMAEARLAAGRERMVASYLSELDPRVLAQAEPVRP
ncbi:hypothetical protein [Opitutus sp. ER46]|uniref:hypothetical protein n=1 Tax=Opitutus sp. ER46 TaxID=2161864 RepID=UPI000D32640B|nr:hypothetical protein [Opitutus sp. ER46]PTX98462.1 hypothetical protein DB354_04125 [Opitutus sp. ER46]